MGSLTSCNDFLDREPLDKVTPEKFFSAEADLAAYAINNYKFVTVDDKYGINLFGKDNDTDNQASISRKTKCSTFAKHFVPKSHLLTQFKM